MRKSGTSFAGFNAGATALLGNAALTAAHGGDPVRDPDHETYSTKVFWALFIAIAGLVLARVVDPVTAQQVIGAMAATGV